MKRTPSIFSKEIEQLLNEGLRPYQIAEQLNLNKISTHSYIKTKFNLNFLELTVLKTQTIFIKLTLI